MTHLLLGSIYAAMLRRSGGRDRIEAYAKARRQSVEADALHARKSALFQDRLKEGLPLRPGVGDAMAAARARGAKLALVSTTSPANIDALLAALKLDRDAFDLVLDADAVREAKPAPQPYLIALDRLGIEAREAVAVEDNPDGLASAVAAGLRCYALPGLMHDKTDFGAAVAVQDVLKIEPADKAA